MASLQSIAELSYRKIFPEPTDETALSLAEFIETAKSEYAYQVWALNRADYNQLGENNIPSILLSETTLKVVDNKVSIKELKALRGLPNNMWIQQLGGFECEGCKYLVVDMNKYKLLCDDESVLENTKFAIVVGNTIKFPNGTFSSKGEVDIIYANMGQDVDGDIQIDDAIGGALRRGLDDIYGKRYPEDKTNNSTGDA